MVPLSRMSTIWTQVALDCAQVPGAESRRQRSASGILSQSIIHPGSTSLERSRIRNPSHIAPNGAVPPNAGRLAPRRRHTALGLAFNCFQYLRLTADASW